MSFLAERVVAAVSDVRAASLERKDRDLKDKLTTHVRGLEGDIARKTKAKKQHDGHGHDDGEVDDDEEEELVKRAGQVEISGTTEGQWVDIEIQFIGASKLPKMDVVGSADPYFVAKVDGDKLTFVSTVKADTLTPVWNEIWRLKNVPANARLDVEVFDKDNGAPHDDYIGKFHVGVNAGAKEAEIEGPLFRRNRGSFWLKIDSTPSPPNPRASPYIFDGPIRFSRHSSLTVGLFTSTPAKPPPTTTSSTNTNTNTSSSTTSNRQRLYSTWKLYLRGVPLFFGNSYQHWNEKYKAAQSIFGSGPGAFAVRRGIMAGHRMLYARSTTNGFGVIGEAGGREGGGGVGAGAGGLGTGLLSILTADPGPEPSTKANNADASAPPAGPERTNSTDSQAERKQKQKEKRRPRIKPAVYTYIISALDDTFRFSETGAAFFVDFASKHALHANCCERVRYSGEFHLRPRVKGGKGWEGFRDWVYVDSKDHRGGGGEGGEPVMVETRDEDVEWELVIDNNSGTYAPDPMGLGDLKELLEYNFCGDHNGDGPKLHIVVMAHEDERLSQSVAACKKYALEHRGVRPEDLTPHIEEETGEMSLAQRASLKMPGGSGKGHGEEGHGKEGEGANE